MAQYFHQQWARLSNEKVEFPKSQELLRSSDLIPVRGLEKYGERNRGDVSAETRERLEVLFTWHIITAFTLDYFTLGLGGFSEKVRKEIRRFRRPYND